MQTKISGHAEKEKVIDVYDVGSDIIYDFHTGCASIDDKELTTNKENSEQFKK